MPRGRSARPKQKRIHKNVSINGENIDMLENTTTLVDEKSARIAELEKKLADFEARLSKKPVDETPYIAPTYSKKEEEKPLPIITEVTTRDIWELEDRKPVTGIFRMENKKPGEKGIVRIGALRKYKSDHMRAWIFEHGKTYTIPYWISKWLNGGSDDPSERVGTPRCNVIKHNDQWNDLQNKRPLDQPNKVPMYSFSITSR